MVPVEVPYTHCNVHNINMMIGLHGGLYCCNEHKLSPNFLALEYPKIAPFFMAFPFLKLIQTIIILKALKLYMFLTILAFFSVK